MEGFEWIIAGYPNYDAVYKNAFGKRTSRERQDWLEKLPKAADKTTWHDSRLLSIMRTINF